VKQTDAELRVRAKLRELIDGDGRDLSRNPSRLRALLNDHCPQDRRERHLIVLCTDEAIPQALVNQSRTLPAAALVARLSARLENALGVDAHAAAWAVGSWAVALGCCEEAALEEPAIQGVSHQEMPMRPPPGTITSVAGTGKAGFGGDGGPAARATLCDPQGLAIGHDGTLYIADSGNNRVRRVNSDGTITTVAGSGRDGFGGDGGWATKAPLSHPDGLAVSPDGSLYIADWGNRRVRRVDPAGTITTVAGTGKDGFGGDRGPAIAATLSDPCRLAVGLDGSLYMADSRNDRVRRVDARGTITTVAGNGRVGFGLDGSQATKAPLSYPRGCAVGLDGTLYVADTGNSRVRRVDPGGTITTVAGTGEAGLGGDGGPAAEAMLNSPQDLTIGTDGSLYIADCSNHRVRRVDSQGKIMTVASVGGRPSGLAIGSEGRLYVTSRFDRQLKEVPTRHRVLLVWL